MSDHQDGTEEVVTEEDAERQALPHDQEISEGGESDHERDDDVAAPENPNNPQVETNALTDGDHVKEHGSDFGDDDDDEDRRETHYELQTFPGPSFDKCPRADRHDEYASEAQDAEDGRSGCVGCGTVWAVRQVEELSDDEKEDLLERESSVAELADDREHKFDGNGGMNVEGSTPTEGVEEGYDGNSGMKIKGADEVGPNTTENTDR